MQDLTKIEKPLGLLDAETQAALQAHGGPYECYTNSGWTAWEPFWLADLVYRVAPQPVRMPVIPWQHVAPQWKWWARGADEWMGAFYTHEPKLADDDWVASDGDLEWTVILVVDPGTCDWTQSLVQRPEGV